MAESKHNRNEKFCNEIQNEELDGKNQICFYIQLL